MQPTGISPNLVRLLTTAAPDLAAELFTPGKVLEADVVSVYQDKAVLAFGRGVRLEVTLQTPLQEGQRVRVQVQGAPPGQVPAPAGQVTQAPGQPAPAPGQVQAPPGQATQAPGQAAQALQTQSPAGTAQQAETGARPAPIVLKVLGTVAPVEPQGSTAAAQRAGTLREAAATVLPGQSAPVTAQPATQAQAQQPGAPQVLWLPIPLPGGSQGWAQIHIQEDDSPKARAVKGGPVRQVRIWWETPALGPVQVTLESAAAASLSAIFTPAAADSKSLLDQSMSDLQQRLAQAGFPEARVGSRSPAPGEAVEPARIDGASRLDKRL